MTPTTLSVGPRFAGKNGFLHINTDKNYAPTGVNDRAESAYSTLEASSARFDVQILGIGSGSDGSYNGENVIYMDGRHYTDNGLFSVYQQQAGDGEHYQVRSRIPIARFERIPISISKTHSPYLRSGIKEWNNKRYAPVRIILSGEQANPRTDT